MSNQSFEKEFARAKAQAEAEGEARDKQELAKDLILEHMAGIYFRTEQARHVMGKDVTVAEIVNRMPDARGQIVQAVKYAWKQEYMLEAFHIVMKRDGEEVDPEILGNLSAIEAPAGAPIVRL